MKNKQTVLLLLALLFSLTLGLLLVTWFRSAWQEVDWPQGSTVESRAVQAALTSIGLDPSSVGAVQVIHMSRDDNSIILAMQLGISMDLRGWKPVTKIGGIPCFVRARPDQDVILATTKLSSRSIVGFLRGKGASKESCKVLAARLGLVHRFIIQQTLVLRCQGPGTSSIGIRRVGRSSLLCPGGCVA